MKTNFYILLILLLSFSLGNAQSTPATLEVETNETISFSNGDDIATVIAAVNSIKENDSLLVDATEINKTIARSSSDIRIYLNRKRKVSNIKLVFKEISSSARA